MIRRTFLALTATTALGGAAWADGHSTDIVETAEAAGIFSTLLAAVEAADLVDTLKGEGPFTVLAPTDDAFADLPDGTVEELLMEENRDQLVDVLTYHVISGSVMSDDLSDGLNVSAINEGTLVIGVDNGVTVNGADVVTADVAASNGVIHVIDTVLLP